MKGYSEVLVIVMSSDGLDSRHNLTVTFMDGSGEPMQVT